MIIRIIIVLISIISFYNVNAQDTTQNIIIGTFLSPNKKSKIEFIEKDSLIQGILIWNVNPDIKDKFNRKKELKSLDLIGQTIFKNLKYNKYDHSWTGQFYDTESGSTYICDLWFEYNKNKLMARGYMDNPMFGKTKTLKRVLED
ncbi:DUF2147 domain-containing protein [Vicingaceae bacterium]|nr:DUF2147 domain-containing protein [Vicingaceae bacterium]